MVKFYKAKFIFCSMLTWFALWLLGSLVHAEILNPFQFIIDWVQYDLQVRVMVMVCSVILLSMCATFSTDICEG